MATTGTYEKLLQGWVKGLKIEWRHLYGGYLPRRISLPTYPFARERHWFPIGESSVAIPTVGSTKPFLFGGLESLRTALLIPGWKEETVKRVQSADPECLVLLCDLASIDASHTEAKLALGGICRNLNSQQSRREQRFQDIVLQLIQELKLLFSKPKGSSRPTDRGKKMGTSPASPAPIL